VTPVNPQVVPQVITPVNPQVITPVNPVVPPSNDLMIQVNKQNGGMTVSIQQPTQQEQQEQQSQQSQQKQIQIQQSVNTANTATMRGGFQNTVVYPAAIPGSEPTIAIQGGYQSQAQSQAQSQVQSNPIFAIDTSLEAMMADGLMPMMSSQRRFNRGPLQPTFSMMPQQQQQQQQQSSVPSGTIMVNKLG
jgi:hypothetical protein